MRDSDRFARSASDSGSKQGRRARSHEVSGTSYVSPGHRLARGEVYAIQCQMSIEVSR